MYSWGGNDTSTWRTPGAYNYGDARRKGKLDSMAASVTGPRTYTGRSTPDDSMVGTLDKVIRSESENPIVLAVDVTGSMASWPAEIFDRMPLLYQTLTKYKEDAEFAFAAIGDAYSDRFPLQVNRFGAGPVLDDHIKALCPEGGGGGSSQESYELFAYFAANKIEVPNAKSPFLIIFGDEGFYDNVNPDQVKHYIGDSLQTEVDSRSVIDSLRNKFDVYLLHKQYGSATQDVAIKAQWELALGKQRVIPVDVPERAVDVAMGLIAKKWGHFGDFESNLASRHDASTAATVYNSLRHVPGADLSGKSVIDGSSSGRTYVSKPLAPSKLAGGNA